MRVTEQRGTRPGSTIPLKHEAGYTKELWSYTDIQRRESLSGRGLLELGRQTVSSDLFGESLGEVGRSYFKTLRKTIMKQAI